MSKALIATYKTQYIRQLYINPRAGGIRRMGRVLPGGGWEVAQKVPWTNIPQEWETLISNPLLPCRVNPFQGKARTMTYNHGMEENWRPHHELTPRKTMSMSQNRIKENGVKGTDVTNDIVVSPGQTSHEGQVTFDRHHETASQLQEDSFCSSFSFLRFEDEIGLEASKYTNIGSEWIQFFRF